MLTLTSYSIGELMKINGTKVTVYKDKLGPYDAFYYKGCMLSEISDKYKVVKAFDYEGDHIGIPVYNFRLGQKLLYCCIPLILLAVYMVISLCSSKHEQVFIYREPIPYVNEDGDVVLNITNISRGELYIIVDDVEYVITHGDTLYSVPFFASEFTLTYKYNNAQYEEVIIV